MSKEKIQVAISVLTHNRKNDVLACLKSVYQLYYPHFEVVFVDNGSTDGSADAVENSFPEVHVVRLKKNLGAASGRNAGWRYIRENWDCSYILFLDDDTILDPGFLTHLMEASEQDDRIGIACCKAFTEFPSTRLMSAGMETNLYNGVMRDIGSGELDNGQYDQPRFVDACGGFGFLIRMEVLERLNGLDSSYDPYGWEEVDLCFRARDKGYRIRYVPEAVIYHKGGKIGRGPVVRYEKHKLKNYLRFFWTHTRFTQRLSLCLCVPVRGMIHYLKLIGRGQGHIIFSHFKGLLDMLFKREKSEKVIKPLREVKLIDNVTAVIKTHERPEELGRLIESIRKYYPELPILVADDSENPVTRKDVTYFVLPHDTGLSAGRNFLIEKVETKYVLLLDDDFVFTEKTKIEDMIWYLEDKKVDLVAGDVVNEGIETFSFHGTYEFKGSFLYHYVGRNKGYHNETPLYDVVLNFFVAKTDKIKEILWDPEIKWAREHADFFLRCRGKLKITYSPQFSVDHLQGEKKYLVGQRGATMIRRFNGKWEIRQKIEVRDHPNIAINSIKKIVRYFDIKRKESVPYVERELTKVGEES